MNTHQDTRSAAPLWGKFFILTCAGALFYSFAMQILNSSLSLFASETWGSNALGGLLTTVFNIGSILVAFISGRLIDARGRKNCLIFGSLLFGLSTFACALWPTPAVSLAVRIIEGMAKGIISVSASSIVADVVAKSRLAEGIGFYGLANTLAMAFGPMLGLAVVDMGGYPMMFVVCGIFTIITGIFAIWITYEKTDPFLPIVQARKRSVTQHADSAYSGIWKMIEKKALPASINYTIFFGSNCCILVFITAYSREILNLSSGQISLFYTVCAILMFIARLFLGKISDKFGALYTVIPGHIANALSLIILAFCAKDSFPLYLLAGGMYGLAQAAVMPSMNAVAVVDSPGSRSGAANATFYCLMDVGIMLGSAIFGAVIDGAETLELGYRNVYLISLGICAASLLMSVLTLNNHTRARRRIAK